MADIRWLAICARPVNAPTVADQSKFWPSPEPALGIGVLANVTFPVGKPTLICTEAGPNKVARRARDDNGTYTLTASDTSMTLRIQGAWGSVEATFSSPDTLAGLDPAAPGWGGETGDENPRLAGYLE